MNSETLARATFVLGRKTAEQLAYLSDRLGVSRSELVRSVLAEPVDQMVGLMGRVPENPSESDLRQLALEGLEAFERAIDPELTMLRRVAGVGSNG